MLGKNNFTKEDKEKIIMFLNLVAAKAELKMNTQDSIKFVKLLSYMQTELLPKIDDNILEVVKITDKPTEGE